MSKATDIEKQIVEDWNNNVTTPTTTYLKKMGCRGNAEHFGKKQFSPSGEWSQYNAKKSYSKTDIKIGDHKISLKSLEDHIVMSAKKNEAIATFMCVANEIYDKRLPYTVSVVTKEMENMITKGVSPISIAKAKKAGNIDILDAQRTHDEILDTMRHIFDDPVFHVYFLKEVLSGELKFGKDSDGSSTHILILNDKPIMYDLDDTNFLSKVANNVEIRIDFKSSKKTQGMEVGQYRYWSVLQMISREIIKDSVIYEDSMFKKSLSYILSFFSKIKSVISTWSELFTFLDVEPTITISYKG